METELRIVEIVVRTRFLMNLQQYLTSLHIMKYGKNIYHVITGGGGFNSRTNIVRTVICFLFYPYQIGYLCVSKTYQFVLNKICRLLAFIKKEFSQNSHFLVFYFFLSI